MEDKKKPSRVTRRVSFTVEEDERLQQGAEKAGMNVSGYIRRQALLGKVTSINWDALRAHADVIGDVAMQFEMYVSIWGAEEKRLMEEELKRLRLLLEDMLCIEKALYNWIFPADPA